MSRYIGDKSFYKTVISLIIPMMIQQGITSFVSLLDNVMVGTLGTESIAGVAISNQLMFVFYIITFGCTSGASIYGAQFYGKKDYEGVRHAFRFKLYLGLLVCAIATTIFVIFGEDLIKLYLTDSNDAGDVVVALSEGKKYFGVLIFGLFPFVLSQCYSTTLRETGNTIDSMIGSSISIFINLIINYTLIFGNFGFPQMGVTGAAIGTVTARYFEAVYIIARTHLNINKFSFMDKVYSTFKIPMNIVKKILKTGLPLLLNEAIWALSMTAIVQSYSTRGLTVVTAQNISSTAINLFTVGFFALGNAIAILVGQDLGSGEIEKAKDTDRKLIFFSVFANIFVGLAIFLISPFIPLLYETDDSVRQLATNFMRVYALIVPMHAFNHAAYFTMRSGGKTIITFFLDSCSMFVINFSLAFFLSRYTDINILLVYFIVEFSGIIKATIGAILLKSGIWAKNVTQ